MNSVPVVNHGGGTIMLWGWSNLPLILVNCTSGWNYDEQEVQNCLTIKLRTRLVFHQVTGPKHKSKLVLNKIKLVWPHLHYG